MIKTTTIETTPITIHPGLHHSEIAKIFCHVANSPLVVLNILLINNLHCIFSFSCCTYNVFPLSLRCLIVKFYVTDDHN